MGEVWQKRSLAVVLRVVVVRKVVTVVVAAEAATTRVVEAMDTAVEATDMAAEVAVAVLAADAAVPWTAMEAIAPTADRIAALARHRAKGGSPAPLVSSRRKGASSSRYPMAACPSASTPSPS